MRIRMKERREGSPDGRHVYTYETGETYDADTTPPVDDDLATVFLREGWAEDATKAPPAASRAKKVTGPTETKEDDGE